jgi:dTDP-glucose 4,6-dehydratase|tara:strand:- start:24342 stop:25397 length:1056 start_codon:yes stop_codon:yes gene_type:complete
MNFTKNILITGGAGFIGSHLVRLMVNKYPDYRIINFDVLTYAGNLENLRDIQSASNYVFVKGDICSVHDIESVFKEYHISHIIHLAAESHVDRSIENPNIFVETNVIGTVNLLNSCIRNWTAPFSDNIFYHVSTDEVYGSLGDTGLFTEKTSYDPKSPYSASKAASDHFVRAFANTYKLPIKISNCSNNYGPNQFPEKLIPLCINNIKNNKTLPIYGKGLNIRDWLYVVDHAEAIDCIFHEGVLNSTYNIGGLNEWTNIELVKELCCVMDHELNREIGSSEKLITYVEDRKGHDMRYAIDANKVTTELKWTPNETFETGIQSTVKWYLDNESWLNGVVSGSYQDYYNKMYK